MAKQVLIFTAIKAIWIGSVSVFAFRFAPPRECGKPLIVHARQARDDTLRIMREEGAGSDKGGPGGVMHCFTDTLEMAEAAMDMGFYISFSGVVTYKATRELQEVARQIPLERMLIETDAPYLVAGTASWQG